MIFYIISWLVGVLASKKDFSRCSPSTLNFRIIINKFLCLFRYLSSIILLKQWIIDSLEPWCMAANYRSSLNTHPSTLVTMTKIIQFTLECLCFSTESSLSQGPMQFKKSWKVKLFQLWLYNNIPASSPCSMSCLLSCSISTCNAAEGSSAVNLVLLNDTVFRPANQLDKNSSNKNLDHFQ